MCPQAALPGHSDPKTGAAADLVVNEIERVAHPESIRLIEYWTDCGCGQMQLGKHLPSREIAPLMSKLSILEPVDGGRDLQYRLAASGLLARFGRDVTGCCMSELYDAPNFARWTAGYRKIAATGEPILLDVRVTRAGHEFMHHETVTLPVLSRDGSQTWVLVGTFYFA